MSKILLAYSGGLDSAVILHWLASRGHEVTAFTVQLGGHDPEFEYQATENGAVSSVVVDLREAWIREIALTSRQMDAIYGKYFLHVALGKIIIAEKMAAYARKQNIAIVAHGAHKGENDYYRLENAFSHINHRDAHALEIYAPWEDPAFKAAFPDRKALLEYTRRHTMKFCNVGSTTLTSEPTVLGVNYENDMLVHIDRPADIAPAIHHAPSLQGEAVTIHFTKGRVTKVETQEKTLNNIIPIVTELTVIGKRLGIGFVDVVETNIDNSKARCLYLQPATTMWHEAHVELGNTVLEQNEIRLRDEISRKSGELIYHGHWFSSEMEALKVASQQLNEKYNGWVKLLLYPGFARVAARSID